MSSFIIIMSVYDSRDPRCTLAGTRQSWYQSGSCCRLDACADQRQSPFGHVCFWTSSQLHYPRWPENLALHCTSHSAYPNWKKRDPSPLAADALFGRKQDPNSPSWACVRSQYSQILLVSSRSNPLGIWSSSTCHFSLPPPAAQEPACW